MPVPNMQHVVADVAARNPHAWRAAHRHGRDTHDFIRLLAAELHAIDERFGLCGQRGNVNDLGEDSLTYRGEGDQYDPTDGNRPITVIDTIANAGTDRATPAWILYPGDRHAAAWVQPATEWVENTTQPVPAPVPSPQIPADLVTRLDTIQSALTFVINQLAAVRNDSHINQTQLATTIQKQHEIEARVKDVRECFRVGIGVSVSGAVGGWSKHHTTLSGVAKVGE